MLRVLSTPVLYALELTPACNNRCAGCPNVFLEDGRGMPFPVPGVLDVAAWREILDHLAPHAQRFKFTGGEPTLHPSFLEIAEYADSLGVESVLFTNGRWADPAALVDALGSLHHFVGMLVSLHGAQPGAHEAYVGVAGSFEETVTNIGLAVAHGIPVTLSTVLTRYNLGEISAIADLAGQLRANHVVFNRFLGQPVDGVTPTPDELAHATQEIDALRQAGRAVKFGNCIPQCFAPNTSSGCLAGVAYCAVDPWGNVRPCTHSSLVTGNLLEQPISDIWHAPAMNAFRDAIPAACHRCPAFSRCHGGCKALAMEQHLSIDPLARLARDMSAPASPPLFLHPDLCPTGRFAVRREDWGLVLLKGNRIIPVQADAAPLLDMLDGRSTLAHIQAQFGAPGLALVGTLYQRGLVTF